MKLLADIPHLEGVKVLVRADFNVPVRDKVVVDDFRIRAALPTINFLREKGAKVILISHLEDNMGGNASLQPVDDVLKKLHVGTVFVKDFKAAHEMIEMTLKNGDCVLLENLRFFEGEKKNDPAFAKQLASLGDIYVNDAFPVSHREHASIVGVPKYLPSYAGLQFEKEVKNLSRAFSAPHPFLFILGGAKFETKLPLLDKFLNIADTIFVGGALSNDIFKAKGYEVGTSLVSKENIDVSKFASNTKVIVPEDVTLQDGSNKAANALGKNDKVMDSGTNTIETLGKLVGAAKFILWNGPLGLYEDGYKTPTLELAQMIGDAKEKGAESIVGGGDTLAAIEELGAHEKFTFISTGGGAMLDFLALGTLPGIQALDASEKGT